MCWKRQTSNWNIPFVLNQNGTFYPLAVRYVMIDLTSCLGQLSSRLHWPFVLVLFSVDALEFNHSLVHVKKSINWSCLNEEKLREWGLLRFTNCSSSLSLRSTNFYFQCFFSHVGRTTFKLYFSNATMIGNCVPLIVFGHVFPFNWFISIDSIPVRSFSFSCFLSFLFSFPPN